MYGIAEELFDHKRDWDELPAGGCYRLNEWGDYVTEDDWAFNSYLFSIFSYLIMIFSFRCMVYWNTWDY